MAAVTWGALVVAVPHTASAEAHAVAPPTTVWTPPTAVNHTPTGGQPPAANWAPGWKPGFGPAAVSSCGVNETGLLPQYPLERFPVSDRMEALVNTHDGNLTITQRQLTVRGTGENLSLSQVYNNQRPGNGSFGTGWALSSGQDVGLTFNGSDVVLHSDSGYCATYKHNTDGSYVEAPGVHAELSKGSDGKYSLIFDSSNERWTFSPAGWLLSQADRNGNSTTPRYNSDGTTASVTDSQGRVTRFGYQNGLVSAITDPTGTTAATYSYNSASQLTDFTDRSGTSMHLTWTPSGDLATVGDPDGKTYSFAYDGNHRVTKVTVPRQAGDSVTQFGYGNGQTTETDPSSHSVTYKYDSQGRQTSATDALSHSQAQQWTANSDVQTTADGLNNSTTNSYDPLNNLIGTQLPTGAKTGVGYTDAAHPHLPTTVTDPAGDKISRTYDDAGNVKTIHSDGLNADLQTLTYWQPLGLVRTSVDGNGHSTTYDYDNAGNLSKVTPPTPLGPTSYTYDSLSRVASVTDGRGIRLDYGYDKLDRVVSVTRHSDNVVLQAVTYDNNGSLLRRETATAVHTFTYDTGGQLLTDTRTDTTGPAEKITYGYDLTGNLTAMTDPGGQSVYGYDAANRLTSVKDPFGQSTGFGYDNADRRTSVTWPGAGSQTNGYDNSGRQTSLTVKNSGGTQLLSTTYKYTRSDGTDSDQMQSKTDASGTTSYAYDTMQRLKTAGAAGFEYDNAGNMTKLDATRFTFNAADELTNDNRTRSYDTTGNLTGSTSPTETNYFSDTSQLTSGTDAAGDSFTASYDTLDQTQPHKLTYATPTATTTDQFTTTALGVTQAVHNGVRTSVVRDPKGTIVTEQAGTSRYNLVTDYQGSVVGLVSTTGVLAASYRYDPYGGSTATGASAGDNSFHYLGQYQYNVDTLLGYRWYFPGWGRFTSPDPTGQEANHYAYAKDDPINNSDPTGGFSFGNLVKGVGGGVTIGTALGVVGGAILGGIAAGPPGILAGAELGGKVGAILGSGSGLIGGTIYASLT
ncbi:RHS repeat-associated core domain-containing protein [Amycolatopsis sp. PS_44_ISF1]|uniref:RHS repeat-associated core domain-containing protein n=1 Tax=Amycolatopsis sp. PS_44_ISF1 TaxID=2974917 RepID=UPI0028DF621E|nr:RHS repeat-associated core domain-containing protein [Amycolatopsis sp. PS_44_ISF1]MDT8909367.1 RHS repeat protein [Amycolatopsis sp. PS_44_ISF1]